MTDMNFNTPPHMDPAFVEAWCKMEDEGYQYSENNVAKVHLGWLMAQKYSDAYAQRDRLISALTPSAETKAAYMGEVRDEGRHGDKHIISWTAIKEVMALIRKEGGL